eukprot:757971-Hanusia_phi.AAC.1
MADSESVRYGLGSVFNRKGLAVLGRSDCSTERSELGSHNLVKPVACSPPSHSILLWTCCLQVTLAYLMRSSESFRPNLAPHVGMSSTYHVKSMARHD